MPNEEKKGEEIMPEAEDPIEGLLLKLRDNAGILETVLKMLDKLEKGGMKDIIEKIANGAIPSDALYLFEFFTSEPMRDSLIKGGNLALLLIHAITDETTSDALKAISANMNFIAESAISYTEGNEKANALKLYSSLRDPDIGFAIMSMMGALKAMGKVLRELKKEKKMMESSE